jgi:hypothetical protein
VESCREKSNEYTYVRSPTSGEGDYAYRGASSVVRVSVVVVA